MARSVVSCGHDDDTGEAFGCSRPLSGSRTATIGIVAWFRFCRPIPWWVGRCIGFAVVMAQVRRPVPFRTRKLRPGRGDGTALERVWESSTPPHSTYGPSGRAPSGFPEGLFFYSRARVSSSIRWRETDAGRPVGGSLQSLGVPGRWGIPGISGELPALIRWWNRLGNYALFRTQTLRRIEQNHVSRQSDGPAGRRPELA